MASRMRGAQHGVVHRQASPSARTAGPGRRTSPPAPPAASPSARPSCACCAWPSSACSRSERGAKAVSPARNSPVAAPTRSCAACSSASIASMAAGRCSAGRGSSAVGRAARVISPARRRSPGLPPASGSSRPSSAAGPCAPAPSPPRVSRRMLSTFSNSSSTLSPVAAISCSSVGQRRRSCGVVQPEVASNRRAGVGGAARSAAASTPALDLARQPIRSEMPRTSSALPSGR